MRQWGHVRLGRQGRRLRMRLSARPLHPRGGSWVARPSRRLGVSMGLRMVLSHRGMPWWLGALRLRSVTLSFCLSLSENLLLCQKSLGSRRQDQCWRCNRKRDWSSHSGVFATALLVIIIVIIVIVAIVGIRYLVRLRSVLRACTTGRKSLMSTSGVWLPEQSITAVLRGRKAAGINASVAANF